MQEQEFALQDSILREVVRRLVDTYGPEEIYLFGSAARGQATADSDYDLLVVVSDDTPEDDRQSGRAYEVLWGLGVSADVLVWTRTAFDTRRHLQASLPATVIREGTLVHAA